jgi:hypothetical protein
MILATETLFMYGNSHTDDEPLYIRDSNPLGPTLKWFQKT